MHKLKSISLTASKIDDQHVPGADDLSHIPSVKIPVRCPHCSTVHLCEFPEPVVVMALTRWNNMNLYVPCHEGQWCASRRELHAIREHLGEAWIRAREGLSFLPYPLQGVYV